MMVSVCGWECAYMYVGERVCVFSYFLAWKVDLVKLKKNFERTFSLDFYYFIWAQSILECNIVAYKSIYFAVDSAHALMHYEKYMLVHYAQCQHRITWLRWNFFLPPPPQPPEMLSSIKSTNICTVTYAALTLKRWQSKKVAPRDSKIKRLHQETAK